MICWNYKDLILNYWPDYTQTINDWSLDVPYKVGTFLCGSEIQNGCQVLCSIFMTVTIPDLIKGDNPRMFSIDIFQLDGGIKAIHFLIRFQYKLSFRLHVYSLKVHVCCIVLTEVHLSHT